MENLRIISKDAIFEAPIILLLASIFWIWARSPREPNCPIVLRDEVHNPMKRKQMYAQGAREVIAKGYAKYKDKIFGCDTMDDTEIGVKVVIPHRLLDDLKSHPALSFKASADNDVLIDYTFLGGLNDLGVHTIKTKMNPSLSISAFLILYNILMFEAPYTPILFEKVQQTLTRNMESYDDWTPVKIHKKLFNLVARVSARIFQGDSASQNEEWIDLISNYALTATTYGHALKQWPPFLRPLVYRFVPGRADILDQWNRGRKVVESSLKQSMIDVDPVESQLPTVLDHLTKKENAIYAKDLDLQLLLQMTFGFAGIHTTSVTLTQCLYDLAARPEYIHLLRAEVNEIRQKYNGTFTREAVDEMKKMDSFMKEVQRFASPDLTTFQRMVIKTFTIDGVRIPKGTKLELPTCAIHTDELEYENPWEFDGLRFYRLRQQPGEENKHKFVSTGKKDLAWGYGRQACPGRFMAEIEIKLVLAELIQRYDFKLPQGETRFKNIEFEAQIHPDPEKEILFRNRQD